MGSVWLVDLPDVLAAAGLTVDVWPGWETRSRSSGGYDDVLAVFAHHTASSSPPDADMSYMWNDNGTADQPIGAIYLARDGRLTVGAAGATNTQGKGGPWNLSTGTIPLDKGNAFGIAIEAANAGTGEAWPAAQTSAYVAAAAALCRAYGLDPARDVLSHLEWCAPSCPGRKIDPAGPSPYAAGATSWDMDAFRFDVLTAYTPPDKEPEDMTAATIWRHSAYANTFLIGAGATIQIGAATQADLIGRGIPVVAEWDDKTLEICLYQTGQTNADLIPL